jgi:hypothetical protein
MPPVEPPADGSGQTPDRIAGLARGSKADIFDPMALRRLTQMACGHEIPLDALAIEGLEVLTADLRAAERDLSFIGKKLLQQALIDRLVRRSEIAPGETPGPLRPPPIFIVGPFRTGSTFLHRLLSLDPRFRCPTATEVYIPQSAAPAGDAGDRVGRYLEQVGRLSPRLLELHPVAPDSAEECFGLLEPSFLSPSFLFWANVPSYSDWLLNRTKAEWVLAYRHYAQFLSRLDAKDPARRWVLKSPFHLWGLGALLSVFPDALVVQLTRPIDQTAPSTATLLAANRTVFARRGRVGEVRHEADRMMEIATARAETARQTAPQRFLEIAFDDLIRNPVSEVGRIYGALALEFEAPDARRIAEGAIEIGRITSRS